MIMATLIRLRKEYDLSFDTDWYDTDTVKVYINSREVTPEIESGKLTVTVDFTNDSEGVYSITAINDTTGEIASLGNIVVVDMNYMYPTMNSLAVSLQKTYDSEDRSIFQLTFGDYLYFLYTVYATWGYDSDKVALSNQFLLTESNILILTSIMDRVLNRDIMEVGELKVDDSKLVSRIQKRLEGLTSLKDSLVNQLFPEIAAALKDQPAINVEVSSVHRSRQGITVPNYLNEYPNDPKLVVTETEDTYLLTWEVSRISDFERYKIYSVINGVRSLETTIFNNLVNYYPVLKKTVDAFVIEVIDTGGLFCDSTYTLEVVET